MSQKIRKTERVSGEQKEGNEVEVVQQMMKLRRISYCRYYATSTIFTVLVH
jgi:hypothetical protein